MKQVKLFEVRDRATCMPVMAIRVQGGSESREDRIIRRAGYGMTPCVILHPMEHQLARWDAYDWEGNRTLHHAHKHIELNWDTLADGAVVDVEFILGETHESKASEI